MNGFPEWVYKKAMFDLWMGLNSKKIQEKIIEKIESNYEDNDMIEICFHIDWKISKDVNLPAQLLRNMATPTLTADAVAKASFMGRFVRMNSYPYSTLVLSLKNLVWNTATAKTFKNFKSFRTFGATHYLLN